MDSESQDKGAYRVSEHEVRGHTVRIIERPERTELLVDGEKWRFYEAPDGFTLQRDAYRGPYETLVEAVEEYFGFYQPEESGKESGR